MTDTAEPGLILTVENRIAHVEFNRPAVLNAFDNDLMERAIEAMAAVDADDAVRCVVVSGRGRSFSPGFDLKASAERDMSTVEHVRRQMELQYRFIMSFFDCRKPVVAAVHGHCLAGAFEVALACDITVAARTTRFGEPEVKFGTGIVAMLLPWVIGLKQANQILLTGQDKLTSERAETLGIVNEVVADGAALERAMVIAGDIAAASIPSIQFTKRAIRRQLEAMGVRAGLDSALELDIILNASPSEEKATFGRIRREDGLKAALAWRDSRFSDG